MKKYISALDGGTTNTRLSLMCDDIVARKKLSVGARDGKDALTSEIKRGINELLTENSLTSADIEAIVASGMVTSELGLYCVPHIPTPVSKKELFDSAAKVTLPQITKIPFVFIPGVKTFHDNSDGLSEMDVMRGEEVEAVAIIKKMNLCEATLILPGSHMKAVYVKNGKITDFQTTISGELARAIAENTVLKNTIGDAFSRDINTEWLTRGYELCEALGAGAALFKIRVAGNFTNADKSKLYSCLLGIVLHDDILMIANSAHGDVIVGGSNPFRAAYTALLSDKVGDLREIPDELAENAAAYGAAAIFHR